MQKQKIRITASQRVSYSRFVEVDEQELERLKQVAEEDCELDDLRIDPLCHWVDADVVEPSDIDICTEVADGKWVSVWE